MRQQIFFFALMMFISFVGVADSDNSSNSGNQPIILKPIKPTRPARMPAMPIYGEYVEPVLYLYVDESETCEYELVISKDGVDVESASLTGKELNSGYEVSVSAPFSIQLSFENSVSYYGEVL